eukprot:6195037-Pleurochrysis_carterae.AAC.9
MALTSSVESSGVLETICKVSELVCTTLTCTATGVNDEPFRYAADSTLAVISACNWLTLMVEPARSDALSTMLAVTVNWAGARGGGNGTGGDGGG